MEHPSLGFGRSWSLRSLSPFRIPCRFLVALVDEIECVTKILETNIASDAVIRTHVPSDYLIGIGNQEGRLVSLIDLNKILGTEELKATRFIRE
jgi:chemotaxis signal transduction protein